jgi:hypothetical protein
VSHDIDGMFIRQFIRRNKDGSARIYLYLCRNYMAGGKERQELIAKLGRIDVLQESGAVDRLIAMLRAGAGVPQVMGASGAR